MKKNNCWHRIGVAMVAVAAGGLLTAVAYAAPLKSATVTQIGGNKEVTLAKEGATERKAVEKDVVAGKDVLRTGRKSRAELEFTDKSLARLGSNTIFSFDPTSPDRKMKLERGTALIHVPPGLSGARISSPAATAAIRGDVVAMRVNDQGLTQIVALSKDAEGPITVKFNKTGEERILEAGQMLTIDPMAAKMPEPVTIAVDVFVQSNPLLNGQGLEKKEMPDSAKKEVRQTQENQNKEIRSGNLENPHQVSTDAAAANKVAQQGTDTASTLVQATQGGRFSGFFVGSAKDNPPGSYTHSMTIDVRADGTFTTIMVNQSTGERDVTTGTWNTGGTFSGTGSDGNSVTGTFSQSATSMSGSYSAPDSSFGTITGTYSTSRQ